MESRTEEVRKEKKVAEARKMMKVGSSQPSIMKKLKGVVPGDFVSKIAFKIGASIDEVGGKITKSFGAYLPQECLDRLLPSMSGSSTSGMCQEESSTNMLTGSESSAARMECLSSGARMDCLSSAGSLECVSSAARMECV